MDGNDNTIKYQCTTCIVQWSVGDDTFIIYNNKDCRQVNIYYAFGAMLMDVANQFGCKYTELIAVMASIVITYAYNKLNKTVVCRNLTITNDEATLGYKNKLHFTHDIAKNIRIIQDGFGSFTIGVNELSHNIIKLVYMIHNETIYLPGYRFSKKLVICIKDEYYTVDTMTAYETDEEQSNRLGYNLVTVRVGLTGLNGENTEALLTKDRLLELVQSPDTKIVKKLRLLGYELMNLEDMERALGWI